MPQPAPPSTRPSCARAASVRGTAQIQRIELGGGNEEVQGSTINIGWVQSPSNTARFPCVPLVATRDASTSLPTRTFVSLSGTVPLLLEEARKLAPKA